MPIDPSDVGKLLVERGIGPQGGKLLQAGVRAGLKVAKSEGYTRVRLDHETGSGSLSSYAIIPSRFESDPELFDLAAGGFQLGTKLKIENEGVRLLVDIIADPLNLIAPGVGALTKAGKFTRLTASAIRAAEAGGKTVKTIDDALDGVENIIKIAGGGQEYLAKLRAAAQKGGLRSKEFKKLIDVGLEGKDLTDEAIDVLQVLRKDRGAFKDLVNVARKAGGEAIKAEHVLQPTLRGRQEFGQATKFINIEKPFAFTRSLLGQNYGDLILYSPAGINKVIGEAGDAFTRRFKPDSLTQRVSGALPNDLLVDGGGDLIFSPEGVQALNDLGMVNHLKAMMTEDAAPGMPGMDLSRFTDDELLQITKPYNKATGENVTPAELRTKFSERIAASTALGDAEAIKLAQAATDARMEALTEASRGSTQAQRLGREARAGAPEGTIERELAMLEDEAVEGYVSTIQQQGRFILATRSVENLLNDQSVGLAVESSLSMTKMLTQMQTSIMGEVLERSVPGFKQQDFVRRLVQDPTRVPEAFVRDEVTGILSLTKDKKLLAELRAENPFFDENLRLAEASFPNAIEALSSGVGLGPGVTAVADSIGAANRGMASRLVSTGLIDAEEVNYVRRVIRKRGVSRNTDDLVLKFEADLKADKLLVAADTEAAKLSKLGKTQESVLVKRKATEAYLLAQEKAGKLRIERDALAAFADGSISTHRALLLHDFMKLLGRTKPYMTPEVYDNAQQAADFRGKGVPEFMLTGRGTVDKAHFPKNGIPEAIPFTSVDADTPYKSIGMSKRDFEKAYTFVEVPKNIAPLGPLERVVNEDLRQLIKSPEKLHAAGKRRVLNRLGSDEDYTKALFGSEKPVFRNGKELGPKDFEDLVAGRSKGLKGISPKKARKIVKEAVAEQAEAARKAAVSALKGEAKSGFYVLSGNEGLMREAFGLFAKSKSGGEAKALEKLAKFALGTNRVMKGIVLNLSYFHYNVLQMAGVISNPQTLSKVLSDPLAASYRKGFLQRQAVGAAGGAAAGAAISGEEEGAISGGLMGLLWMTGIGAATVNSKVAKKFMLGPEYIETYTRMGRAGWHGSPNDRSIGMIAGWLKARADNLVLNHGADTVQGAMVQSMYRAQSYHERVLWDFTHNGQKTVAYHHGFARIDEQMRKANFKPGTKAWDIEQTRRDRELTNVVNSAFGGHNMSRLLNSKEHSAMADGLLLSRDWTLGNVLGAGNIFLNRSLAGNAAVGAALGSAAEFAEAGFDPDHMTLHGALGGAAVGPLIGKFSQRSMGRFMARGDVARSESIRLYTNAALAIYTMGNLANYAAVGHFMWDNPEGKKLSVAMPGGEFYVGFGKPYKETLEFASAIERDKYTRPILDRLASKTSPIGRLGVQLFTGRDNFGQPIVRVTDSPLEGMYAQGAHLLSGQFPIVLQGPLRAARDVATGRETEPLRAAALSALRVGGFAVSSRRGGGPDLGGAFDADLGPVGAPRIDFRDTIDFRR